MKKIRNVGYQIFRPILKLYTLCTINLKIIGKENIPKSGGFILAGNHQSLYDPILVGNLTPRSIHFLAKKELLDNAFLGPILRFMGIIRVDRETKNPDAKKEAIICLNTDNVICLFPEGGRNRTKEIIKPFKFGAVSFAQKTGKPIIPFAIIPHPKAFHKVYIIVDKPFYVDESDNLEVVNKKFENIIKNLILKNSKLLRGKLK